MYVLFARYFFLKHVNYYLGCGLHVQIRNCRIPEVHFHVSLFSPFLYYVCSALLLPWIAEICQIHTGNGGFISTHISLFWLELRTLQFRLS